MYSEAFHGKMLLFIEKMLQKMECIRSYVCNEETSKPHYYLLKDLFKWRF